MFRFNNCKLLVMYISSYHYPNYRPWWVFYLIFLLSKKPLFSIYFSALCTKRVETCLRKVIHHNDDSSPFFEIDTYTVMFIDACKAMVGAFEDIWKEGKKYSHSAVN